jgi:hypothetical protein
MGGCLWDHVFPFSPQTFDGVRTIREGICTCRDSKHPAEMRCERFAPCGAERPNRIHWREQDGREYARLLAFSDGGEADAIRRDEADEARWRLWHHVGLCIRAPQGV